MSNDNQRLKSIDPEQYATDLEPRLSRLLIGDQISFGLQCLSRVKHLYSRFRPNDTCVDDAIILILAIRNGEFAAERQSMIKSRLNIAFEAASESYETTDQTNSICESSHEGIVAFQALEAVRCATDHLDAVLLSQDENMVDEVASLIADAASDALAATLFQRSEFEIQSQTIENAG